MGKVAVNEEHLADIANGIRECINTDKTYRPSDMSGAVYEVYDTGKQAQYDEFWDSAQSNDNNQNYDCAFSGTMWNDKTFKPKYDIKPTTAWGMFQRSNISDLTEILKTCGVVLDFSNCISSTNLFTNAKYLKALSVVDLSQNDASLYQAFYYCTSLRSIDFLKISANGSQTFSQSFQNCNSLKNIIIGAETKGESCSELITMPFNEVFSNETSPFMFKQSFYEAYSQYFKEDAYGIATNICFETGQIQKGYTTYPMFLIPTWFVPEDKNQEVSFYLCKNDEDVFSREAIGQNISFSHSPLSNKSVSCIISALKSDATGKTLTLKKSAVNEAFGINVDEDEILWDDNEYAFLRHTKDNWTINYV